MSKDGKNVKPKSELSTAIKKSNNTVTKIVRKIKKIKINKSILKYIVCLIVIILLFMGIGKLISNNKSILYPVVFNTSEGDLYLMNSKGKEADDAIKLAVGESVSIVKYANTSDRYVLFKKGTDLYLFDAKNESETTKVIENVKSYSFSLNDKYVVILDNEDTLYAYNYKSSLKIESDVSEIIDVSEDRVIYIKDGVVYVRSINPKKEDREKVTAEYGSYLQFTKDGKNITYIDKDNKLLLYNVSKKKAEKIAEDVKSYYCDEKSCDKMFYVASSDNKKIYYYDGKKATEVASGIYAILAVDVEHKQIAYSTTDNSKYNIYFQMVGRESILIEENVTSIRTLKIFEGKEIYYITGKNEVKYVKVSAKKMEVKSLATDVTGYLYQYDNGFAYVSDVDKNSNGTLYFTNNGRVKKIDTNVNSSLITVNKEGDKVYYFKDYDMVGTLYVTSGSKNKKIDENVYTFSYINDKLLYYIKDYSAAKSRGDLYIYRNGKTRRVYESVSRIAGSPVIFNLK